MDYCYLNGEIPPYEECRLHVSDLQLQRGYGVFDFFRSRSGHILWLEDYTDRMFRSVALSGLETSLTRDEFVSVIGRLQEMNGTGNRAFKVLFTGGYSENLASVTGNANVVILNLPWEAPDPEKFGKGVNLISYEYVRPDPEIKSLHYFNTLKLRWKLKEYQAIDVMYHSDNITEASRANLFFVHNGIVFTPASSILHGITRKQVLGLIEPIRVEDVRFEQLFEFDEVFLTSTSQDVMPVVSVDGRKIGNGKPGNVTREILSLFRQQGW